MRRELAVGRQGSSAVVGGVEGPSGALVGLEDGRGAALSVDREARRGLGDGRRGPGEEEEPHEDEDLYGHLTCYLPLSYGDERKV